MFQPKYKHYFIYVYFQFRQHRFMLMTCLQRDARRMARPNPIPSCQQNDFFQYAKSNKQTKARARSNIRFKGNPAGQIVLCLRSSNVDRFEIRDEYLHTDVYYEFW